MQRFKKQLLPATLLIIIILLHHATITAAAAAPPPSIQRTHYGFINGTLAVDLYTLRNGYGTMYLNITNYGAIITSLVTPDRHGSMDDIVLGFDTLEGYTQSDCPYFGAVIGRHANRIRKGHFSLVQSRTGETVKYNLTINNPPNHLHGGFKGFDKKVWTVTKASNSPDNSATVLEMQYKSVNGEEGYPGTITATVRYTLFNNNMTLQVDYEAQHSGSSSNGDEDEDDQDTIINLTNHSYFNLAVGKVVNIKNHFLELNAQYYTPVDDTLIPTGEIKCTNHTPFDFFTPGNYIGSRMSQVPGGGYDHNYVLLDTNSKSTSINEPPKFAAQLSEPITGRIMKVYTTQPGIQFYTGNFLNGIIGKGNRPYVKHYGLCLETQHYPDAPNHPNFPSTVLRVGERYKQTTQFQFGHL